MGLYEGSRVYQRRAGSPDLEHYTGVTEEKAAADVDKFLKTLAENNILDDGIRRGSTFVRLPKDLLDKLWPPGGLRKPGKGGDGKR